MSRYHPLCRPPRGAGKPDGVRYEENEPLRLGEDGKWRADNGRPARAFIYKLGDTHFVAVADCGCPYPNGCPLGTAMTFADELGLTTISIERRRRLSPREVTAQRKKAKQGTKRRTKRG